MYKIEEYDEEKIKYIKEEIIEFIKQMDAEDAKTLTELLEICENWSFHVNEVLQAKAEETAEEYERIFGKRIE